MTKLFVYEYLTGGGIDPDLASEGSLADLSALIVEGRAMRDALVLDLRALDDVQVTFASSRFEHVDPALAHCRAVPGEPMTHFVSRVAREHDYAWVIAPECDGLLRHLHDAVGGARWLGCTSQAIETASGKRATAECLAARGIAVTPALAPERGNDPDHADVGPNSARRWVVKPDDGAGGLDTFLFDRFDDACAEYNARVAAGRNPVLQAWVDGEPLSLSLICGETRAELVSINRQQIGVPEHAAAGRPERVVEFSGVQVDQIGLQSENGRVLEALAQRVFAAIPGLRGFVGIDLVWHPQRGPVVIEVNPRLTAAYAGLSARLGRNLAGALLEAHGVTVSGSAIEGVAAPACRTGTQACGAAS